MKIALGSANFGMAYGQINPALNFDNSAIKDILTIAAANNIEIIDTAQGYGNAEQKLGDFSPKNKAFKFVTKIPGSTLNEIDDEYCAKIEKNILKSLNRLHQDSIHAILIHQACDLTLAGYEKLIALLERLKSEKTIKKYGVSVYDQTDIELALQRCDPGLIQVPINIFDQRLLISGHLSKLKRLGIEIHARSIFLQGALLSSRHQLPEFFNPIQHHFEAYELFLESNKITRMQACLGFIKNVKNVDHAIVGVCSSHELRQVTECFNNLQNNSLTNFEALQLKEELYLNPSNWMVRTA